MEFDAILPPWLWQGLIDFEATHCPLAISQGGDHLITAPDATLIVTTCYIEATLFLYPNATLVLTTSLPQKKFECL
jgi:hypothetical protein